ncbi:DNA methyltransferase [Lutibacter sp. HS1-25]|uniref:type ISP restriction/modification enzyme n=1 Tax=Lutibacter sp. HS1-25 TaxID=2485000 RepID=UPI0010124CCF|nr:type ISP restriction/modification enzyme [Lutibacter sp. HS1-25]RXP47939.1 DNA methyltransferase [Lutibacter sp. HS1-25]
MTIQQYIQNINQRYLLGNATEHTFRGDLQQLIESLVKDVQATNEPKRQSCGAPDYILTKKDIPVGFIEAKDIGDKDLEGKKKTGNKEQFDRYKASLSNLIFTDYLEFHLYHSGEFVTKIAIGEITENGIKPITENFIAFENLIKDFCVHVSQTIKSSKQLAEMMAGKARLLSDVIEKALNSDEDNQENSTLNEQMVAFKDILIHDITPKGFADVYAQTIAYGLFAARLHDPSLDSFSRQEAAELIPKSNPFLRKLFGYIAGPDIDDRIKWIVDNLTEIFLACNVEQILKNYGKATKMEDPIIHFYETFLSEYDPKLRKARGVWYTPAPVVNFIVRAVDDILKTEFDLPQGLADTSKTTIKVKTDIANKNFSSGYKEVDQEVHKVQILDPATGTGTFLAEVIKHINNKFKGQEGIWSSYVENSLIPRLNGFELLMASYAMAHLQLDLLLKETGFKPTKNQRTRVYLTNSLEEAHPDTGTLFANWLSSESNEANHIKRDTPVMCIIGNPPYAVSSTNKNDWIQGLISDYKKNLNERKINLDDDYIKFIRYGQHYIDKNGSGVLAYISNNSFLDGVTHRQMRKHLLECFDKIYILDLHGNAKKKEVCPDGSPDQNVFDIMQGVSINIFVKTDKKKKTELGEVYHFDLQGKRNYKYETLNKSTFSEIKWLKLEFKKPYYFFVPKDFEDILCYEKGFKVDELLNVYVSGVESVRDSITIHLKQNELKSVIEDFVNLEESEIASKYNTKDARDWKIGRAKDDVSQNIDNKNVWQNINYRPFDIRKTFYTGKQNGFVCNGRYNVMKHMLSPNIGLLITNKNRQLSLGYAFISEFISDRHFLDSAADSMAIFPLYLYTHTNGQQTIEQNTERVPNINSVIVNEITKKLTLTFTNEKEITKNTFAPIDILDYIYAVLHSPTYREKYKEFLKIDFPRVPYPKDAETFWQLVKLGGKIRQIHLLESPTVENYITSYPKGGDNKITTKVGIKDWELFDKENAIGRIWINEEQYFDNIPLVAWEFYIGGYQPAQKWLKDRKERTLEMEDIFHYQKIIVALTETDRLMKEIDKIEIE